MIASLSVDQKLRIARQLARLNVDIIEAGFPVSSPGDFESVSTIAREIEGPIICGLARAIEKDILTCAKALKGAKRPAFIPLLVLRQYIPKRNCVK